MSEPVEKVEAQEPEDVKAGTAPEVEFGWSQEDQDLLERIDVNLQKVVEYIDKNPSAAVPETQKANLNEAAEAVEALISQSPADQEAAPEKAPERRSLLRNKRKRRKEQRRQ